MGWEYVELGKLYEVHNGLSKGRKFFGSGFPFLSFSTVFNNYFLPAELKELVQSTEKEQQSYSISRGDVFVTRTSETFDELGMSSVALKDYPYATYNGFTKRLRPITDKVLPEFIGYYMRSGEFRNKFRAFSNMTTRASLRNDELLGVKVPVPPMTVQRRIAEILAAYDALIENNQRQIKLLEEAAHRIYREWFVKLRFPGYEKAKVVDGVPEGWRRGIVSDVCDTVGGGTPSTKVKAYYERGNIPWVTPTDITRNGSLVVLDTSTKITEDGLQHSSAKMVPAGTILMTSRASVGFFGIADFEVCTNQGFIACIPKQNNYQMYLLHNLMDRVDEIRGKSGGATYLEIRKSTFRNLEIAIPSDEVLDSFQEIAHNLLARERVLVKSNKLLQEARDRLLPKLLSGEIAI